MAEDPGREPARPASADIGEAARAHVPARSSIRSVLRHATEFDRNSSRPQTTLGTREDVRGRSSNAFDGELSVHPALAHKKALDPLGIRAIALRVTATIESSTARNRPHDWAERREPVTQCCRSRHRLVLKGCDVRKSSPPPAMVAGFSYGFSADGLARYGAAQRSSHRAAFGIVGLCRCEEQTSPRKRDRRARSAVFQFEHAPRPPHHLAADSCATATAGAQDAGAVTAAEHLPHASIGMAPTASRPRARSVEATGLP